MAIMVEEFVAVVAMVLWGLTTDALLELSGENKNEITTDDVHPAARASAHKPDVARASAKARRCICPGPCCLARYIRFVYGWFEVMCDFMVAIFEHVLDRRLPTKRGKRLYLTEGDVHRQGTGGRPKGRYAASSRGKTSRSLASRLADEEAKVRALTSARIEMEAVACQMREAMAAHEAEVAWLRQELEDARGEAAEQCAALVSSSAEMHRVLEVLDELDKALDEACERTREVAERAKAADESKCAEMEQIIRDRVLVVEVLRGRNAELMVEVGKCVRGSATEQRAFDADTRARRAAQASDAPPGRAAQSLAAARQEPSTAHTARGQHLSTEVSEDVQRKGNQNGIFNE